MAGRKGYTLIELMLTLGILVVVAGLSVPLVNNLFNSNKTTAALDQVRGALVKVRSLSMAEGRSYTFQIMENTGRYKVDVDQESEMDVASDEPGKSWQAELPEGVIFVKQIGALQGTSTAPGGVGSFEPLIVFHPDGTASKDEIVLFGVPGQGARGLQIRGLTGSVTQFDLNAPERP